MTIRPAGVRFSRLVATVAVGAFLTSFDNSAVNAALPLFRNTFGVSIGAIQWVATAGLAVTTGLLLVFGHLGDLAGSRRVYLCGFCVFVPGLILCGTAGSLPLLIAARAFQGVGAAMLLASSPALLTGSLPLARRGVAFGAKASFLYLGLIAGPAVGVWMAGRFGWRYIFWMQTPLALAVFVAALRFIPRDPEPQSKAPPFDFAGGAVWACIPISILLMLGHHSSKLDLGASRATLALVAVFLVAALVAIEWRRENPVLGISCFRCVEFSVSATGLLAAFAASYVMNFALPFYVVEVLRQKPAAIGGLLTAGALARAAVAPFGGKWSDRVDARWLTVSGMLLLAASLGFLARAGEHLPMPAISAAVIAAGGAIGFFVPANNSTLMGYAPPGRYGAAAGILTTARTLGMLIGVVLGGTILSTPAAPTDNLRIAFGAGMLLALAAAAFSGLAPGGTASSGLSLRGRARHGSR